MTIASGNVLTRNILACVLLLLLSGFIPVAYSSTTPSESSFYYTLQIDQGRDLGTVENTANQVAQLLPLKVFIIKVPEGYSIRSGKSNQSGDLENIASLLKTEGFSGTEILFLQIGQEDIVKIINPDAPEIVDTGQNPLKNAANKIPLPKNL